MMKNLKLVSNLKNVEMKTSKLNFLLRFNLSHASLINLFLIFKKSNLILDLLSRFRFRNCQTIQKIVNSVTGGTLQAGEFSA
jgi:hypothetical protein